jgi:hypothetical protein
VQQLPARTELQVHAVDTLIERAAIAGEAAQQRDAVVAAALKEGIAGSREHAELLPHSFPVDDHPGDAMAQDGGQSRHWHYFQAGANDDQAIARLHVILHSAPESFRQRLAEKRDLRLHQAAALAFGDDGDATARDSAAIGCQTGICPAAVADELHVVRLAALYAVRGVETAVTLAHALPRHTCKHLQPVDVLRVDAQQLAHLTQHPEKRVGGGGPVLPRQQLPNEHVERNGIAAEKIDAEDRLRSG